MADSNAPPHSWFAPPEGAYTLVSSLSVPSSSSLNSATAHFTQQLGVPVASVLLPAGSDPPVFIPPPLHGCKMTIAEVQMVLPGSKGTANPAAQAQAAAAAAAAAASTSPMMVPGASLHSPALNNNSNDLHFGFGTGAASGGLGLDTSAATLAGGGVGTSGGAGMAPGSATSTGPSTGVISGLTSPTLAERSGFSPTIRRKPLGSSFSIPTLSSLAGGADGGSSAGGGNSGTGGNGGGSNSRPSRPFRGTSSSFVRSWEGLPLQGATLKAIAEAGQGRKTLFGFYTHGKGVVWCEIGQGRPKEAIARVMFSIAPTCVDVNRHTASHAQLDVLVGFCNGDIFWFGRSTPLEFHPRAVAGSILTESPDIFLPRADPFLAKYTRLNKGGVITSSSITSIQWLPPSAAYSTSENHSNLFLTSHADGTLLVWDKDREDWSGFVPTPVPTGLNLRSVHGVGAASGKEDDWDGTQIKHAPSDAGDLAGLGDIIVSRPAPFDKKGQATKFNPVSHWRVSRKAINSFAFSPDLQLCATVGNDGCLRIINAAEEKLLDTFASYFGALNCVSWSADGRFVVTGGQDDLCTIYAPLEQRLVARCQGHSSWVTGVAWDPWRSDERTMRFASVGEDCKLVLWDLSSAALTRPKSHTLTSIALSMSQAQHPHARRLSLSSQRLESTGHLPISPNGTSDRTSPVYHPSPRRDDVAHLQPVMVKTLSHDLFSNVFFLPQYLLTVSRSGQIRQYDRPPEREDGYGHSIGLSGEFASSVVALDRRAR
ncbi:BZ3500_MvSof-1268-A1-R1_Chr4-3g07404 [Microbotryum saponariae]|uniref:BZ3500_MvSof-1268-A1-R1_Chr4-3g07404 protein n=1 Tax=Microbotryum saponariae TaxID=289078 RepID=A0A2X0KU78_9BASI|nr:BZ3500_MvSof-1268-A1-R1_Chr4-3g07404 [Microbotryum saponariae]SDA07067.1 BZ3501_MvSof-1269-A2-R1_Chr4-2g07113 [Microbotryum saponariae]